MAKQLSNARTETRIYLDESSQADFLDTEVDLSINRSYHDVVSAVIEIYEEFYSTTTPLTYAIIANQQEYTIDSSLIKVSRVEINYNPTTSGSVASRALPVKKDEIRGNLANTNVIGSFVSPIYYLHGNLGAQKIGFTPVPQTADTTGKSISVWGIQLPADLVNATDDVNIPYADKFIYLVALRAAAQLLRKGQQEEAAAGNYLAEYRNGILEMQNFLKDRISDDGTYIVDSANEDIDFTTLGI